MELDIDRLREDLINYFGTALNYQEYAMVDLVQIDALDEQELITLAIQNGFDIDKYRNKVR